MPLRRRFNGHTTATRLGYFEVDADLEAEWLEWARPFKKSESQRERVTWQFLQAAREQGLTHLQLLPLFYLGMIKRCGLSETTAKTYVHYVCTALQLRGEVVRRVRHGKGRMTRRRRRRCWTSLCDYLGDRCDDR